ncbi:MAG TPA: T9SS sorting signal type C domain-containing protein, partial [Bacillaceae bacterium]|nr:T9SS sorting signal type C domain-containing protein [Bacillaceae bacterium]
LMQGSYNADSAISAAIFAGNDTSIKFDNYSNNPVSKLKVYKNLFKGVKQGVCIFNSENNYSTDIEVYHNDLGTEAGVDKITHSIYLRGVQGFNIYNNIIYDLDITFTGGSDYSGIYVGGNSINGKIYKNQILGIDRQTNHLITGIKLSSTNSSENVEISITNNMIANVRSLGGGSLEQGGYGIYLEQGKGYKIFHNTVSMKHNQATGITAALFVNSTAANLDIRNNIFSITQTDQGNTSFKTAIIAQSPSFATAFNHLDYNNYVIDSSQVRSFVGGHGDLTNLSLENSDYKKTLDDWKATSGQDLSSGSQETNFVSDMNLHISDSNAWVNNTGVSLAEEFAALGLPYDDIDDQPRSITNPDIGADEFGIPSFDPGICETTLYWNGTSWGDENGNPIYVDGEEVTSPTRDFLTEIRGAYDTEIHGSFSTCELTIATGGSLRIAGDDYVFIVNRLINNLSAEAVIVENNGSIVQETDFNENVGAITYKRKAMPMFNYDYTYWGSPVTGQTTAALSPNSGGYSYRWNPEVYYNSTYGVYMQRRWGNENSDYVKYSGVMEPGHGYIIKAPNNFPSNTNVNPSIFTAKFIGVPNSGTYIVETTGDPGNLLNGSDGNDPDTGYPQGDYAWNFFGNPYPSAIDIEKFRLANNQILGDNVYLWSHNTKPVPGETYYQYVANDFAVYNAKLGQATCATPYPEGSTTPDPNYNHPTRFIAAGQGFFMPAKTGAVQFNNSMRVSTINGVPNSVMPNNHFYKVKDNNLEQEEIHNIKLSIRNEQGAFHQILLGYVADASNGIDDVDGILFGGNYVSLYSVVENYHLVVQGRSLPFNEADEVPLGFSLYMPGEFSIHLDYFDGLFEENNQNQDIYLYDSYLDVLHNLKNSPYEFTSEEGSFNDRFVLKYMNTLSVDNPSLDNNWAVYSKDGQLHVKTNGFDIKDIVIYDMLGRIVYQQDSINNNLYTISTINNNQILIVKITSTDNITSTKKHLNRNK